MGIQDLSPIMKAICEVLGEGVNAIIEPMSELIGDKEKVLRYFKALGADSFCMSLPEVEPMDEKELSEFHPIASHAFFKALYQIVGERGLYAFCKSVARILLREFGDRALEELEKRISFGEHRAKVKVRAEDYKIYVILMLNRKKIPKEEVMELGKQGTVLTTIAALLFAYPKDVKRISTKPVEEGLLYVYQIV